MTPRRILVTGASGFLGQALGGLLKAQGHAVVAAVRRDGVLVPDGVARCVVGEINGKTCWREALAGCDAVVHLAAHAHAGEALDAVAQRAFISTNVDGSAALLDAVLASTVKHLVFMSSCKVYGERSLEDAAGLPLAFDARSPVNPAGPYGESKLAAENLLRVGCEPAGIALDILRPPLVYGPGHKANLRALMRAIARGFPLPFGAIHNTRSLLYLHNLTHAIGLALAQAGTGTRVFPLSDIDLSTPALVKALAHGMGLQTRLFPVPPGLLRLLGRGLGKEAMVARLTESMRVGAAEARRELGWHPVVPFEEAIEVTGEWFNAAVQPG